MRRIALIAALANNRVIGIENRLPWHLPDDLQHFKQLTLGKPIIMGRKTWESLPGLLPGRRHIVISRNLDYQAEGAEVYNSIDQVLDAVPEEQDVLVVGGARLYQQMLPLADMMYLTLVDADIQGDAFFPQWEADQWQEKERSHHQADERHRYNFDFLTLMRKKQV